MTTGRRTAKWSDPSPEIIDKKCASEAEIDKKVRAMLWELTEKCAPTIREWHYFTWKTSDFAPYILYHPLQGVGGGRN